MTTPEHPQPIEHEPLAKPGVKIGITGSLSSGKSTLLDADHFHPHHPIHLVEEQARVLFQHEPMSPEQRLTYETQLKLATMIRFAEFHAEEAAHQEGDRHPVFICDRTVADALVYAAMSGEEELADRMHQEVSPWLPQYDRIVVCDIAGVPYEPDPIRNEDPQFRIDLHEAYLEVFDRFGIGYEVLSGSLEQREARLMEIIDECWAQA